MVHAIDRAGNLIDFYTRNYSGIERAELRSPFITSINRLTDSLLKSCSEDQIPLSCGYYAEIFFEGLYAGRDIHLHDKHRRNGISALGMRFYTTLRDGALIKPPSFEKSIQNFTKACELGHGKSCMRVGAVWLELMERRGNLGELNKSIFFFNRACEISGKESPQICDKAQELADLKAKKLEDWENTWQIRERQIQTKIKNLQSERFKSKRRVTSASGGSISLEDKILEHQKSCDHPQLPYQGAPERLRLSQKEASCNALRETEQILKQEEEEWRVSTQQTIKGLQSELSRLPSQKDNAKPDFGTL